MKNKTMMMAAIAMTVLLMTMTGCNSMCGKKGSSCTKSSMSEMAHPAGCKCEKCAAM